MKKMICMAMALVCAFSLAACGGSSAETTTDATTEAETEEVVTDTEALAEKQEINGVLQVGLPEVGEEVVLIETNMGDIWLQLYPEEAPLAVENFKALIASGYYDGIIFHRVMDNFMIQGGDPTGTGMGGESAYGEKFPDEISPNLHFYRGALAMANSGANTNGSQFFICQNPVASEQIIGILEELLAAQGDAEVLQTADGALYTVEDIYTQEVLDYYQEVGGTIELEFIMGLLYQTNAAYTIFGQVFEGMDVVDAIAKVEVGGDQGTTPVEDVIMESVTLVEYTG
ncbi:peptidylprolyl isomerase [Chakrabartyella piscis]|uniref:peptidylprolyl isomerase n=1 Tax=Chakrabartyella piscis TaxID=2918914 RepID=UPI002958C5B6|nr:peptidylprolyl isomerase [Chakrabartyella piscis]